MYYYRVFFNKYVGIRKVQILIGKRWKRIPFKRTDTGVVFVDRDKITSYGIREENNGHRTFQFR